ncbi:hypothetical protein EBU71_15385 [bacterium]|nr:hypothetical protein [Candidatus Elulimicrobium humile]
MEQSSVLLRHFVPPPPKEDKKYIPPRHLKTVPNPKQCMDGLKASATKTNYIHPPPSGTPSKGRQKY